MKLGISHDEDGNITTLYNVEELHGAKGTLKYVPAKGERHHFIELPKEFEAEVFEKLPKLLRVNAGGAHPHLERKR